MAQEPLVLPEPTGPYAVGRTSFRWVDEDRPEVLSERSDDNREIAVLVWFPAQSTQCSESAPYLNDPDVLTVALSEDEASFLSSVQTHSIDDAVLLAPEPTGIPVVLFSPGNGTFPALYTTHAEDLASHGYLVVVVDHPYDSIATRLSDGRIVEQATQPQGEERARVVRSCF